MHASKWHTMHTTTQAIHMAEQVLYSSRQRILLLCCDNSSQLYIGFCNARLAGVCNAHCRQRQSAGACQDAFDLGGHLVQ
jgi:hypothetical protein